MASLRFLRPGWRGRVVRRGRQTAVTAPRNTSITEESCSVTRLVANNRFGAGHHIEQQLHGAQCRFRYLAHDNSSRG